MKQIVMKLLGRCINVTAILFPKWSTEFAFTLFCKVRPVGISENGKQFLAKATTTFLEIEGHSAVLHRWGNGSKNVLFLHGWMSHSKRWQTYIDRFNLNEYSLYSLDAPGHGMATGNHLNLEIYRKAIVQSIEKAGTIDTLISHSLGGLVVAYSYLNDKTLPVKSFVIMGSPSGMDVIFGYFQKLLGTSERVMRNLEAKANSILKIPHQEIFMENFFSNVKKPVLVIHEKTDTITPFKPIEKALQQNKNIETLFTEGLNHDLKSEEVYDKVVAYIQNGPVKIKRSQSA
ncbi:alpha/beta hydrolase [Rasiella sp. SM2506]|uniref:alpha/beta hydrolase n=1 Tax=Rasiella sp. SM2506 TaxID=3423914 RepID=UPI003D78B90F